MWPVFFAIYIESLQARKHWGRSCCSFLLHPCPKWTCPLLHSKKPWLWRLAFSVSGAAQSTSKKQGNYKKKKKNLSQCFILFLSCSLNFSKLLRTVQWGSWKHLMFQVLKEDIWVILGHVYASAISTVNSEQMPTYCHCEGNMSR